VQIISLVISSLLARARTERGQDLIEYALFGGLLATLIIAVSVILAVAGANPLETMFNGIEGCIDFAAGGCTPF
jgi:Flp pilus assembly pilin Flp